MNQQWRVRLAEQAERDLLDIAHWTVANFGQRQAEQYMDTISLAIESLIDGPDVLGARAREELAPGVRTLHAARLSRKARHFVVFRISGPQTLDVLRVLHDSMELSRHLPP
jgi:toxin ParE1/3/4